MDAELLQLLRDFDLPHEVIGTDLADVWNYCEMLVGGDGARTRQLGKLLVGYSPDQTSGKSLLLPSPDDGQPSAPSPSPEG